MGKDSNDKYRVYSSVAKSNEEPPFVVIQIPPGPPPQGTYSDQYAIENLEAVITSWGETGDDAWKLCGAVDEIFQEDSFDVDFEPYHVMLAKRSGYPEEMADRDTTWRQVIAIYRIGLGR